MLLHQFLGSSAEVIYVLRRIGREDMEIKLKSLIMDEANFQALETSPQLGDYSLSEALEQLFEDTFLDTQKTALMAKGFYLQLRKEVGKAGNWLTIKSLGEFTDQMHTRAEYTSFLPEGASVIECPDARITNMVFELSLGFDLLPFLKLEQKRIVRQVKQGEKHIAELSLDRVSLKSEGEEKLYGELEIELKSEGTHEDLNTIMEYLLENHKLVKDPFSKFERALLFRENLPEKTLLSFRERAVCMQLAAQEDLYGKQAGILLSLDKGLNTAELSLLLKVPEPEIETLHSRFDKERLSIFPFSSEKKRSREFYFQAGSSALGINWENVDLKKWTIETLLNLYGVNEERAEQIKTNALTVFDGLFPYHRLGQEEREMLGLAALLQDIGSSVSPAEKASVVKEILLTHPLKELKLHELRMLALIMELQSTSIRKKDLSAALERSGISLSPEAENKALILASLIRFVDLPGIGAWKFLPGRIRQVEGALEIEIFGENAGKAVKKAEQKSELWEYLFGTSLRFIPGKDPAEAEIIQKKADISEEEIENNDEKKKEKQNLKFAVRPENPMALVAWRVFSQQFARMLALEKATRKGEDIEALHDMRVAVRRMRAAARVFEAYLDSKKLEPQINGLRKTLGALGDVRDLDVFREKAEEYIKKIPSENEHDLDPLFEVLAKEKGKARENMLAYLDSKKYASFKKDFSDFLSVLEAWAQPATTRKHDALPHRVRDVLPSILYSRLADISAYSEWVEGPHVSVERLHRLRIAAKGLRYTLEFFEGVLGEDAKAIIEELKKFQDHLGNLHDAIVAIDLLGSFLETGEWGSQENSKFSGEKELSENMRKIEDYLKYKEEELQVLLDTFPETWGRIWNEEFSERIESMVKRLYTSYL
jgi:CHAD domain-containing protein